ncbi:MAG: GNAT family N-acetyltransferase [Candidatus Methanomethylophilaceae archaeon]
MTPGPSPSASVAEDMLRDGMLACHPSERELIGDIIGESFCRDPVWVGFFPPLSRFHGTRAFFLAAADYVMKEGHLLRSQKDGGAFLGFMDHARFSMRRMLEGNVEKTTAGLLSAVGMEEMRGLWGMADAYDRSVHGSPELSGDIYLFLFFTAAPWRGKGEGSKIMRSLISSLDRRGLSCSLSTHNRKNLDLYRHLGFRVVLEQSNSRGDGEFFLYHP